MIRKYRYRKQRPSKFQINEQDLIRYLEGKMTLEEQHRFEGLMEQDPFLRDAMEGLSALSKKEISHIVFQLNANLKKQLKPRRKHVRFFFNQKILIWLTVLILLLLVLISWWYIQVILNRG